MNQSSNVIYGLGVIGALLYFLMRASTFQGIVLGIIKAILWPGFLVYRVLGFLNM